MKKTLGLVLALVLTLALGATAFATTSPTGKVTTDTTVAATTAAQDTALAGVVADQAKAKGVTLASTTPVLALDVTAPAGITGTQEWTFKVTASQLTSGKTYLWVHVGETTESGTVNVSSNGAFSITLHGASPVAFYEVSTDAATTNNKTASPKTAENIFAW